MLEVSLEEWKRSGELEELEEEEEERTHKHTH